jgi:hypothetical protein
LKQTGGEMRKKVQALGSAVMLAPGKGERGLN